MNSLKHVHRSSAFMGIILALLRGTEPPSDPLRTSRYALIWQGSTWRPRKTPGEGVCGPFFLNRALQYFHIFPIRSHHKWRTHALTMLTCASAYGSVIFLYRCPISAETASELGIGQSTVSRWSLEMVHNYPWVLDEFGTGVNCRIRKGNEYPTILFV